MSKGWGIEVKGLKEVINKVNSMPGLISDRVDTVMDIEAKEMTERVIGDAPQNMGFLISNIEMRRMGAMDYTVMSSAKYSIYVEFGTRRFFNNPYPELSGYISQFKGGGKGSGSGKGFYDEILEWVRNKGFASTKTASGRRSGTVDARIAEEQAAWAIYLHIIRNGTRPHPFFFKNYYIATANIIKKAKEAIEKTAKKL